MGHHPTNNTSNSHQHLVSVRVQIVTCPPFPSSAPSLLPHLLPSLAPPMSASFPPLATLASAAASSVSLASTVSPPSTLPNSRRVSNRTESQSSPTTRFKSCLLTSTL